jgi:hypothetical protein
MMATKERIFSSLKDLSLEALVPEENFYRRLERSVDLSFSCANWSGTTMLQAGDRR